MKIKGHAKLVQIPYCVNSIFLIIEENGLEAVLLKRLKELIITKSPKSLITVDY